MTRFELVDQLFFAIFEFLPLFPHMQWWDTLGLGGGDDGVGWWGDRWLVALLSSGALCLPKIRPEQSEHTPLNSPPSHPPPTPPPPSHTHKQASVYFIDIFMARYYVITELAGMTLRGYPLFFPECRV